MEVKHITVVIKRRSQKRLHVFDLVKETVVLEIVAVFPGIHELHQTKEVNQGFFQTLSEGKLTVSDYEISSPLNNTRPNF